MTPDHPFSDSVNAMVQAIISLSSLPTPTHNSFSFLSAHHDQVVERVRVGETHRDRLPAAHRQPAERTIVGVLQRPELQNC